MLEISGAVILMALIIVSVKLNAAIRQYSDDKNALQMVMNRKQQLDRRNPYPSLENVRQETENFNDILDGYDELNETLRAGQIEPQAMQPAVFMSLLERELRQIRNQLNTSKITCSAKCAFGFDRYTLGKPPAAEDIPRLAQQLKIITALCQAISRAGVSELLSITREEFEANDQSDASARRRRSAPPPTPTPAAWPTSEQWPDDTLYSVQHFWLNIKASETAAIDLLNLLARLPMFTVTTSLLMTSAMPASSPAAAPVAPEPSAIQERKILIGKELVNLQLELDVYQFAPSLVFNKEAAAAE